MTYCKQDNDILLYLVYSPPFAYTEYPQACERTSQRFAEDVRLKFKFFTNGSPYACADRGIDTWKVVPFNRIRIAQPIHDQL